MFKLTEDKEFFSLLFDVIPAVALIVNASARVYAINSAAIKTFKVNRSETYLKKSGNVFHCINTIEDSEACGTKEACKKCIIRNTAMQAIEGKHIKRAKGKLVVELDHELRELSVLVSASTLEYKGENLAIVIVEDISDIVELQGLLPICSSCKKIYTEEGYWKRIEEYIEAHSEVAFTHDICPQCIEKLYKKCSTSVQA
ncbi:MAG: hypothetical protein PHO01_11720 [Desulfotomaculaceae bacterium]|nr:hypothetical protein [Desulfotomaculaceae bacterium]